MKEFGLLTEPRKKVSLINKLKNKVVFKEELNIGVKIIVAEIPYTAKELAKLPRFIRYFLLNKFKKAFIKLFDEIPLYTLQIKRLYDIEINSVSKTNLPVSMLYDVCDIYLKKYAADKNKIGYIIDRNLSHTDIERIKNLSEYAEQIYFITENSEFFQQLLEIFSYEYGICVNYKNLSFTPPVNSAFIIDTDKGYIRIGRDIFIDKAEVEINLKGYILDGDDIKLILPYADNEFVELFPIMGKKRLTLNKI